MKAIKLLLFFIVLGGINEFAHAQKIVEFSQYKIIEDQYGKKILEITPHTRKSNADPKYDKSSGVYGVLICYEVNGEKKAARQDMTRKLADKGKYDFRLTYSTSATLSNVSVEYFNLIDTPRSEWPEKDKCL